RHCCDYRLASCLLRLLCTCRCKKKLCGECNRQLLEARICRSQSGTSRSLNHCRLTEALNDSRQSGCVTVGGKESWCRVSRLCLQTVRSNPSRWTILNARSHLLGSNGIGFGCFSCCRWLLASYSKLFWELKYESAIAISMHSNRT